MIALLTFRHRRLSMTSLVKHAVAQLDRYTISDKAKKITFVKGGGILKKEKL